MARVLNFRRGSVPRSGSYFPRHVTAICCRLFVFVQLREWRQGTTPQPEFPNLFRSNAARLRVLGSEMRHSRPFLLHHFPRYARGGKESTRCVTISATASKVPHLQAAMEGSEKCLLRLWHQILSIFGHAESEPDSPR